MSKIVLVILGVALLVALTFIGLLTLNEKAVPDILELTTASIITGVLGLLAPRPGVQEVEVVNRRSDAVPVDPA
jgi:hypothetical protein